MINPFKLPVFILLSCLLFTGCLQKSAPVSSETQQQEVAGKEETKNTEIAPELLKLFPRKMEEDDFCEGIIQASSLWTVEQELSVYPMGKDGVPEDNALKTLPVNEQFRICNIIGLPSLDINSTSIYGQMADGSGWALLYDYTQPVAQFASLETGPVWPQKTLVELKSGASLLHSIDGPVVLNPESRQLITGLENGEDGKIWARTLQGWFELFNENGPCFFSTVDGLVAGPFAGSDPLEEAYRRILLSKTFNNYTYGLSWGYALCDINQDQVPELLMASGGHNRDQRITVYGLTSNVVDSIQDGSISASDSLLYASSSGHGYLFHTKGDEHHIFEIISEEGTAKTKELLKDEISKLDVTDLEEVSFSSVSDFALLDSMDPVALSSLYPHYPFTGQGMNLSDQTILTEGSWKLNYNMKVRSEPDRTSMEYQILPKGTVVYTSQEKISEQERWGQLVNGGWICLEDESAVYATPEKSHAEANSTKEWYALYSQTLQSVMQNPEYGNSYEDAPLWYLWNHPDYSDPILVVKAGNSEASYRLEFYATINGNVDKIAEMGAGHSAFSSGTEPGTFYQAFAHMGCESIDLVTLENGTLTTDNISSRQDVIEYQTPDGEYWQFLPVSAW